MDRKIHLGYIIFPLAVAYLAYLTQYTDAVGYAQIPYDANKTALCELLNGTCVSPSNCAVFGLHHAYGGYDNTHGTQQKFACNLTTVCCYSLQHHFHVPHGYKKPSLLKTLIFKANRTVLCESLGGTCTDVHSCAVFQHFGGKGHRFDCNLTTLCCYRSSYGHGFGGHGHYGYGNHGHGHDNYGRHSYDDRPDYHDHYSGLDLHHGDHHSGVGTDYIDLNYFNDYHHGFGRRKKRSLRYKIRGKHGERRWSYYRNLRRSQLKRKLVQKKTAK